MTASSEIDNKRVMASYIQHKNINMQPIINKILWYK